MEIFMKATSVFGKILVLFLVFALGFLSCIGALIGGGYLLYSRLTLNHFGVDTSKVLSENAEKDLTAMSLAQLIAEFSSLKGDEVSVEFLEARYGLILPKDVEEYLTEDMKEMSFGKLFSKEGVEALLADLYFGKLFGYERKANPDYDPSASEESEFIWVNPDSGERVVGINGVLADIAVADLLDGGIPTQEIMEKLSVGDIMELTAKNDLPVYMEGEDGDLVLVEDIDPIVIWYTNNNEQVASIVGTLANKHVNDLATGIDDISLGDVFGTVAYNDKNYTYEVKHEPTEYILLTEAESIVSELADLTVEQLSSSELTDRVNNMLVADLLGYTKDAETGEWLDSNGNALNAIMDKIANSTVGNINTTVDTLTYAEITGLVAVDENGDVIEDPENYEGTITWYEKGYEKGASTNKEANSIMVSLADLSVSQMSDSDKISDAVKEIVIGDAMGYVKDGDTWYTDDTKTEKATNIIAILADCTVGGMNDRVKTVTFAEIAGLKQVYYLKATNAPIPESELANYDESEIYSVWEDETGKETSGLMSGLAHLTVDDFSDSDKVSEAVKDIKVGDAMGNEKVNGVWYTKYDPADPTKNRLTGLIKAVADERVGDLDARAQKVTIAEIAGLIAVDSEGNILEDVDPTTYDGVWYEEYTDAANNKPATGLMSGLAHLTMGDIQDSDAIRDAVGDIAVGDAMGYQKVGGVWYSEYDEKNPANNKELTGLVKAIADSKVENLNDDMQTMKFGTVAGLTQKGGKWMDGEEEATGINAALADLTVGEMSDSAALSEAIQKVTVADAMNYTKTADGYVDKDGNPVKSFMAVIAGEKISNIQTKLDGTPVGEFMGYAKNPATGKWMKGEEEADGLMQKVCSRTMTGMDGLLSDLVIKDVIDNYDEGIFSFIDENTKITEMSSAFETLFNDVDNGVTMGELEDAKLINLGVGADGQPLKLSDKVRGMTFADFMQKAHHLVDLHH